MRFSFLLATCTAFAALALSCSSPKDAATDLRCEYQVSPMTVDVQTPRFTWNYDGASGFTQHSFIVNVASSEDKLSSPDIWSSGQVVSSVPFVKMEDTGLLKSDRTYYWQVKALNADGSQTIVSAPERFQTALMDRSDWKAVWLTDSRDKDFEAAPMFRKEFSAEKGVTSAKIFMSASPMRRCA